ncbi:hypothetical protein ACRALDRAFT_208628 [Sodiomyces alcalophilus JCM 7366]|uniref:uncharacterized protein n=1 Tax=Sodiomyces alcalophilus JCM 7366 TaxID=591952 RepID=UPI0039B440D8
MRHLSSIPLAGYFWGSPFDTPLTLFGPPAFESGMYVCTSVPGILHSYSILYSGDRRVGQDHVYHRMEQKAKRSRVNWARRPGCFSCIATQPLACPSVRERLTAVSRDSYFLESHPQTIIHTGRPTLLDVWAADQPLRGIDSTSLTAFILKDNGTTPWNLCVSPCAESLRFLPFSPLSKPPRDLVTSGCRLVTSDQPLCWAAFPLQEERAMGEAEVCSLRCHSAQRQDLINTELRPKVLCTWKFQYTTYTNGVDIWKLVDALPYILNWSDGFALEGHNKAAALTNNVQARPGRESCSLEMGEQPGLMGLARKEKGAQTLLVTVVRHARSGGLQTIYHCPKRSFPKPRRRPSVKFENGVALLHNNKWNVRLQTDFSVLTNTSYNVFRRPLGGSNMGDSGGFRDELAPCALYISPTNHPPRNLRRNRLHDDSFRRYGSCKSLGEESKGWVWERHQPAHPAQAKLLTTEAGLGAIERVVDRLALEQPARLEMAVPVRYSSYSNCDDMHVHTLQRTYWQYEVVVPSKHLSGCMNVIDHLFIAIDLLSSPISRDAAGYVFSSHGDRQQAGISDTDMHIVVYASVLSIIEMGLKASEAAAWHLTWPFDSLQISLSKLDLVPDGAKRYLARPKWDWIPVWTVLYVLWEYLYTSLFLQSRRQHNTKVYSVHYNCGTWEKNTYVLSSATYVHTQAHTIGTYDFHNREPPDSLHTCTNQLGVSYYTPKRVVCAVASLASHAHLTDLGIRNKQYHNDFIHILHLTSPSLLLPPFLPCPNTSYHPFSAIVCAPQVLAALPENLHCLLTPTIYLALTTNAHNSHRYRHPLSSRLPSRINLSLRNGIVGIESSASCSRVGNLQRFHCSSDRQTSIEVIATRVLYIVLAGRLIGETTLTEVAHIQTYNKLGGALKRRTNKETRDRHLQPSRHTYILIIFIFPLRSANINERSGIHGISNRNNPLGYAVRILHYSTAESVRGTFYVVPYLHQRYRNTTFPSTYLQASSPTIQPVPSTFFFQQFH